jgi:FlaA1/EpsC-like NDP-sugar epimerase
MTTIWTRPLVIAAAAAFVNFVIFIIHLEHFAWAFVFVFAAFALVQSVGSVMAFSSAVRLLASEEGGSWKITVRAVLAALVALGGVCGGSFTLLMMTSGHHFGEKA